MDLGSHCLDLLMYFCGPMQLSSAIVDRPEADGVEDAATVLLRLTGGAHGIVSTYWSARIPDEVASNAVELWGTEGSAVSFPLFSKDSSGTLLLHTPDGTQDLSLGPGRPVHQDVLENFRVAVEIGGPVLAPPEDALAGLEIIERAYGGS